jgi:hypothetical protein
VIVDGVQDQLEWGVLGRALEVQQVTESVPLYPDESYVELTYTPVRSIQSVAVDGLTQPAISYSMERSGVQLFLAFSPLGLAPSTVSVAYTAGLGEPAVSAARLILLSRSARILNKVANDELGLASISVEGYSAKWLAEDSFTENEVKMVQAWKRRGFTAPPRELNIGMDGQRFNPFDNT